MTQNSAIASIYPDDEESLRRWGNSRWVIGVVCHTLIMTVLGFLYAESAQISVYRYDLSLQAALHLLIMVAMQNVVRGREE